MEEALEEGDPVGFGFGFRGEAQLVGDLVGEGGVGEGASSEHEVLAAGFVLTAVEVFESPNVAVGDDGDVEGLPDFADAGPVNRWGVALDSGAGVDGEPGGTALGGHFGVGEDVVDVFPAESQLGGDGDLWGDGVADGLDDVADSGGVVEEGGAAVVSVDGGGGASEVDVYGFGTCSDGG